MVGFLSMDCGWCSGLSTVLEACDGALTTARQGPLCRPWRDELGQTPTRCLEGFASFDLPGDAATSVRALTELHTAAGFTTKRLGSLEIFERAGDAHQCSPIEGGPPGTTRWSCMGSHP